MLRFLKDKSGNFAIFAGIVALPLVLAMGGALDMSRALSGRSDLQDAVDAAALALAGSDEMDMTKLRATATQYLKANTSQNTILSVQLKSLSATADKINLSATGRVDMAFLKMIHQDSVSYELSAEAIRASNHPVEVALVLDNTWSMTETDSGGASKIATLKRASTNLVNSLITDDKGRVKIGLVPYADYVNVGTKYRSASWISVPDDYSVAPAPKVCETKTTKSVCVAYSEKYACTTTTDGVVSPATCGGACTKSETQTVPPYESCTGGGNPTYYKWYGCVGSRKAGTTRLNDGSPSERYPGYLATSQKCLNPIVPLTTDKVALNKAINDMIINIGSYMPYTYIPAGVIWGQNMLSHPAPLEEADNYGIDNADPRKIMILMTDGDNTRRFQASDGAHVALSSTAATAKTQVNTVNQETAAICNYSKTNKIEIFTVAFMVDNADALNLLKNCATDPSHFFDASDSAALIAAFSGIAGSISAVRLSR